MIRKEGKYMADGFRVRWTREPSLRMIFSGGTRNQARMPPQAIRARKPMYVPSLTGLFSVVSLDDGLDGSG
jgi:hypothetical protein